MATLAATAPQKVFACLLFFFFGPCRFARLPITENWWFVVDTGREDEESERSASPVSRASCVLSFSGRMKNAGGQSCWVWASGVGRVWPPPSLPPSLLPSQSTEEPYGVGRGQVSIHVTTTLPSLHLPIQTVLIVNMSQWMNSSSVHTFPHIRKNSS
jgi:hypothetical protein